MAFQPEKVSNCAPGYLGPYRSDPNFTRGKKLGTVAVKSIPQSSYADPVQSSIQNDRFVVARRKVTKRVDRSLPWLKSEKRPKTPPQQKVRGPSERKTAEKPKKRYRPGHWH